MEDAILIITVFGASCHTGSALVHMLLYYLIASSLYAIVLVCIIDKKTLSLSSSVRYVRIFTITLMTTCKFLGFIHLEIAMAYVNLHLFIQSESLSDDIKV